jgi:hypothetical protein
MLPADILSYRRRIAEATAFRQLVAIDSELTARAAQPGANAVTLQFFHEAIELRANPTVYAALRRQASANAIPGVEPETETAELESLATLDPRHVDPDNEESVEAFVRSAVDRVAPRAWVDVQSDDTTTADLASDADFMAVVDEIESEEAGRFPRDRPIVGTVLTALANTRDAADVAPALRAHMPDEASMLTDAERLRLQDYANARVDILRGAAANADLVGFRRRARAMGLTPDALTEVERQQAEQDLPNYYRAMVEVLHEVKPDLAALEAVDIGENPKPFLRMQQRIQTLMDERVQQKRTVDRALEDILGHGASRISSQHPPTGPSRAP